MVQTACQAQVPPYQYAIAVPVFGTVVDCRCGNTPIATGNYITNTEATCFSTDNLVVSTSTTHVHGSIMAAGLLLSKGKGEGLHLRLAQQYVTLTSFVFQECADGTYMSSHIEPDFASCFVTCVFSSTIMYKASLQSVSCLHRLLDTPHVFGTITLQVHAEGRGADRDQANTQQCFCDFVTTTTYSDCSNMGYVSGPIESSKRYSVFLDTVCLYFSSLRRRA
jgi:hypothetical protein